ncbi:MAG: TIGR02147 family protein [Alphaproteobacteria bacterium]|nr:TIGR02147 family protein [Alphaproteobacteria bacterium]
MSDAPYDRSLIDKYTDYRRFVIDALDRMKRTRKELAEALELSEAMLSQILSRKRKLRATLVPQLADFFDLDEQGRQTLAALVDLDNESARARRTAWATVSARQRYLAQDRPSDDMLELMSTWYIAAAYELAACEGFRPDPFWIASTINPPISEEQAQHALQTLLRSGLLQPDARGDLRPVEQVWSEHELPSGPRSEAMLKLQRDTWRLAQESYDRFRINERHNSVVSSPSASSGTRRCHALRAQTEEILALGRPGSSGRPTGSTRWGLFLPLSDYSDSWNEAERTPSLGRQSSSTTELGTGTRIALRDVPREHVSVLDGIEAHAGQGRLRDYFEAIAVEHDVAVPEDSSGAQVATVDRDREPVDRVDPLLDRVVGVATTTVVNPELVDVDITIGQISLRAVDAEGGSGISGVDGGVRGGAERQHPECSQSKQSLRHRTVLRVRRERRRRGSKALGVPADSRRSSVGAVPCCHHRHRQVSTPADSRDRQARCRRDPRSRRGTSSTPS